MADKTWKRRERQAAAQFGALRQCGSGCAPRPDEAVTRSKSDSDHPNVFLEVKSHAKLAVRTLWDKTKALAKKEKKTPALMLYVNGKTGGLLVVHEDDMEAVLTELIKAKKEVQC